MSEERKLVKPSRDFPLTPVNGYWRKIINGTAEYFGPRWCAPEVALAEYLNAREALEAGRPRPQAKEVVTLHEALDTFLKDKEIAVVKGELTHRAWREYRDICDHITRVLGGRTSIHNLSPLDFRRLKDSIPGNVSSVANLVGRAMVAFNWVQKRYEMKLQFGDQFNKPKLLAIRKHRASLPNRKAQPEHILQMIEHAKNPQVKAMIWLGINCGFGNSDVGKLEIPTVKADTGWLDYPRPKTGVQRRVKLWDETVDSLREVIGRREKGLVFITKYGNPWIMDRKSNPLAAEIRKITRPLGIPTTFYDLRRTFQTIGDNSKDPVAVMHIMGHAKESMSEIYRQEVSDERLEAVVKVVYDWLQSGKAAAEKATKSRAGAADKAAG